MRIQTAVVLAAGLAALATASTFVPSGQGCLPNGPATGLPFCNTSLPVAVRVADLVSRLVGASCTILSPHLHRARTRLTEPEYAQVKCKTVNGDGWGQGLSLCRVQSYCAGSC
jgi:hypothetical protein